MEFDILLIKAQLSKNIRKKTIKRVTKILEKKSLIIYKKLVSLIDYFIIAAKLVYMG